jgi:hypothetical protein
MLFARHAPADKQRRYEGGKPDREARENDVKCDCKGELDASQQDSVHIQCEVTSIDSTDGA